MSPSALLAEDPADMVTTLPTTAKRSAVLHRSLHNDPVRVVAAQGNYLTLQDGRLIMDATGGAAVSCLGHGNERIRKAMIDQMDEVSYCHSAFYSTAAGEELATELIESTNGQMSRAFIVSSGSEAMEAAMKLARQYFTEKPTPEPQRIRFIARQHSYHGTTLGALSMSGHVARRALFEPLLSPNITHISPCNAYRDMLEGESEEQYVHRLAQELDDEFQRVGADTVCAFVAEPVVGAALGCVPPVPGYFRAMKAVCKKYGALLVLDEIMSGVGRTGTLHAWQSPLVNVVPDIQTLGKGLGGGYAPVAALLIGKHVVDTLDNGTGVFSHGQTYQGHPVSCRAALEVLREIKERELVDNVAVMGEYFGKLLDQKIAPLPYVGNVRGKGLFWGIEFVKDKATKEPFPPSMGVGMGIHERGMLEPYNISLYPGSGTADGKRGDHVLLAPAYTITRTDIELIVDKIASVIRAYFKDIIA